ncbi:MAG: molybdopterin-dependent oxidoreductase [Gemmatimonadales bacterium]|nr:molybdopterin-dependent oxidoreductase [Gemmatimonadales bacterium]
MTDAPAHGRTDAQAHRRTDAPAATSSLHPADHGRMQKGFNAFPPEERWTDWVEGGRHYSLVATTCFNCEAACGLLAYVDQETRVVKKFEGNPRHPGSRGRNCAKGPATLNQIHDPERILYPLKRAGARGEGKWERVSWDEALDDLAARIRKAIVENRHTSVMYHVGRPGEDGYTERVLAAWGIDGHNSHTNICSAGARAGYAFWMGMDRPNPDHSNAKCILLISAHLESGHYFNPHAQRIIEAKQRGATIIVMDPRLSNTATHADHWLPTYPGSETTVLLAIANVLIREKLYDREFVRRWVNWEEYLTEMGSGERGAGPQGALDFQRFEAELERLYADFTPEQAEAESGVPAATVVEVAHAIARAGSAFSAHTWRAAAAGNLGGWMTARCLFFLNVLTGSVGTPGGTIPNSWTKFVPAPHARPPHPKNWNELTWPKEYPLAFFEMSFLLPHFLKEGRGTLDVYFTRVYNPVWTNPDGFTWIEVLRDEKLIGRHAALTPVWSETAWFADYVLPVGLGSERHDLASFETHAGSWLGFRQPVQRALKERLGEPVTDTRDTNPGEVWEENEFWIELSWRIDPDGAMGIRKHFESPYRPGQKLGIDEYYRWIFENSVPGLKEAAAVEGLQPMEYMRKYASFDVPSPAYGRHEQNVPADEMAEAVVDQTTGRVYTAKAAPPSSNIVPMPVPPSDAQGRRAAGVMVDGAPKRGFPTPSGKLEFYSSTLAAWGWKEVAIPTVMESHVSPRQLDPSKSEFALVPTFRLPILIHTRSGNAKWLNEIAHSNPLWIATTDGERLGVEVGDLVRVETEIGHFVVRAWVTEGMRPGVVACSHHMGRWRVAEESGTDRWSSALVRLEEQGDGKWRMRRLHGVESWTSDDRDSSRVWWQSAGVHQNLTFAVHPDPVSGAHAWHQKVRVRRAEADDQEGDIVVDTAKSHEVYQEWLKLARPAPGPGGMRRPYWLLRPLRPSPETYRIT